MINEQRLVDLLANGLSGQCAFCEIDYENGDYRDAKMQLIEEKGKDHLLCREEVWARMIFNGKKIKLLEYEENTWHNLTLTNLRKATKGVKWQWLEYNGDFYDYEAILQKAIFGEVIYG